jgi:hypothetical protein
MSSFLEEKNKTTTKNRIFIDLTIAGLKKKMKKSARKDTLFMLFKFFNKFNEICIVSVRI